MISIVLLACGLISAVVAQPDPATLPQVWPVGSGFGAHIYNVNLENLSDGEFDLVHEKLLHHKVIVVRNQGNLTVEGQRRFTQRFGPLHVHLESSSHYPGYTDVNVVSNIKNDNGAYIGLFGAHVENFHSDLSWTPIPTKITVLKSVIRPDQCGDTIFADTNAAYDGLDAELKKEVENLQGNYCYLKLRNIGADGKAENLDATEIQSAAGCAVHPLITTHPITGRSNLYANPSHTASVVGLESAASEALLQRLFAHTAKPEYALRHKYNDGDVIIWDNRAVHHRATECPTEFPRKLVRTTVSNDAAPAFDPAAAAASASAQASASAGATAGAGVPLVPGGVTPAMDLAKDRINAVYPPKQAAAGTAADKSAANRRGGDELSYTVC